MNEVHVVVEAEIKPTEDPEKVRRAVENIIGEAKYEVKRWNHGALLTARAEGRESLVKFKTLLRVERIQAAARAELRRWTAGNTITIHLNKQAAYMGRVSFSEPTAESPLGPIKIQIKCEKPSALIEWLTSEI